MSNISDIHFESGEYLDKNWDDKVGTFNVDCVPNKETAIEIAQSIFSTLQEKNYFPNNELSSVFYDEVDGVWIVDFALKSENKNYCIAGGDCAIAIQKKDAKVLRIWAGE